MFCNLFNWMFFAEIYRENAGLFSRGFVRACAVEMHMDMSQGEFVQNFTRKMPDPYPAACAVEMHMDMSQEAFCAEIYTENAGPVSRSKHCVRACAVENAKRPGYHLDWTPGLNTYAAWTHCLGKKSITILNNQRVLVDTVVQMFLELDFASFLLAEPLCFLSQKISKHALIWLQHGISQTKTGFDRIEGDMVLTFWTCIPTSKESVFHILLRQTSHLWMVYTMVVNCMPAGNVNVALWAPVSILNLVLTVALVITWGCLLTPRNGEPTLGFRAQPTLFGNSVWLSGVWSHEGTIPGVSPECPCVLVILVGETNLYFERKIINERIYCPGQI